MNDDDQVLIDRSKRGDKSAFEAIVLKYQNRVYNICRYMLGPADVEDAAQDSFIKAYRNISGFTPSPGFSAWITRITINTCLDYKRRPKHLPLAKSPVEGDEYEHEEASRAPGPEGSFASKQAGLAVEEAIRRLSDKLRAVLVLHEIEDLSYEETAAALGISMGTVKSRLFRAREELRKLLDGSREHL
ncbi:MAG: sigma-70 family RNA polymerase sigma factor [Deltaproteobacteria bacterium]|nr:sigma-70 family RNA polymerase sigma factor [Deltaproteobacteria bacterium]